MKRKTNHLCGSCPSARSSRPLEREVRGASSLECTGFGGVATQGAEESQGQLQPGGRIPRGSVPWGYSGLGGAARTRSPYVLNPFFQVTNTFFNFLMALRLASVRWLCSSNPLHILRVPCVAPHIQRCSLHGKISV